MSRSAGVSTTHSSDASRRGERQSTHTSSSVKLLQRLQCRTVRGAARLAGPHAAGNFLEAEAAKLLPKGYKIDYTGEIPSGDTAEVRTVVVRANDRIPLNYRLINQGGDWKVYDVIIEGVSLVSNYRSQFSRIIHESSYAELVKRLKTKVSELTRAG